MSAYYFDLLKIMAHVFLIDSLLWDSIEKYGVKLAQMREAEGFFEE